MRKWVVSLLLTVCLILPVSAQAVYRGDASCGSLDFTAGEETAIGVLEASLSLKNDEAYPVGIYVQGEAQARGALRLTVRQSGKTTTVFEGDITALAACRVLLCRLEAQRSAVVYGRLEADEPIVLPLTAEPIEEPGGANRAKLIFYVCIWMALVILACYLAIVLANKFGKKK